MSMVGDDTGVALWNLMSQSDDNEEKAYFNSLNAAATKHGVVWFKDSVTQRKTNKNQTTFQMSWDADNNNWSVSVFLIPDGANIITDRVSEYINRSSIKCSDEDDGEWVEINPDFITDDC